MITTIYKITDTTNEKVYIGQTTTSLSKRFSSHKSHAVKSNRPNDRKCILYQAMCQNGVDNFTIEPLEVVEGSRGKADKREIHWIAKLDSINPEVGYNKDRGGHTISDACRKARIEQLAGSKLEGRQLEVVRENGMKMAKSVCQIDKYTGEIIAEFPSIIEASRSTGCDRRSIQRQLKGEYGKLTPRSLSNLKYIWKYKQQLTEQSN